jgi:hypothetical protein
MTRNRLPNRRAALTLDFGHVYPGSEPRTFSATIGFFASGAPAEVFLNSVNGTDKQVTVDAHDAAVVVSFALQHGASLAEIGRAMLRDESGRAHGFLGAFIDAAVEALGDWPDDPQGGALAGDDDPPRPTSPAAAEAIPEASEATL